MAELTPVHAAVLAVLVLLLLGLAAINLMIQSGRDSTGFISGGAVEGRLPPGEASNATCPVPAPPEAPPPGP